MKARYLRLRLTFALLSSLHRTEMVKSMGFRVKCCGSESWHLHSVLDKVFISSKPRFPYLYNGHINRPIYSGVGKSTPEIDSGIQILVLPLISSVIPYK